MFSSRGSRHSRFVRSLIKNREVESATSVRACSRHHHLRQVPRASFWLAHNFPPGDSRSRPFVLPMSGLGLLVRVPACLCRRLPAVDSSNAFCGPNRENKHLETSGAAFKFSACLTLFVFVLLPLTTSPQVTAASERAENKDAASTMDSASPRGSKRGVEEVNPSGQKMGGERPAPTPERDGRADEEVGEGDVAAGRGDLDLCKRNEV